MKKYLPLFLMLSSISAVCAATELKGTPDELKRFLHPDKRTVSLHTNVERRAYADQAIISVIVKTEEKSLSKAMDENASLRKILREMLVANGVANENIQNSKFSSSPQYGWFGDKPKSFEVVNRVAIKINSEVGLQSLANIADQYDEMTISATEFKHTKKDELYLSLKDEAMKKILAEKAYYEKNLNVSLSAIYFHDNGISPVNTQGARVLRSRALAEAKGLRLEQEASYADTSTQYKPPQSSFEEVEYHLNMRVDFELESN